MLFSGLKKTKRNDDQHGESEEISWWWWRGSMGEEGQVEGSRGASWVICTPLPNPQRAH